MFRIHRVCWLLLAAAAPSALAADPAPSPATASAAAPQQASSQKAAAAPPRMVALFLKRSACPEGWEAATNTRGRLLVAVTAGGNVGVTVGSPISTGQPPSHAHTASVSVSLASKSLAAANGGSNNRGAANGTRRATVTAVDDYSGLPFYGYLACRVPLGGLQ